jgi:predicted RNase H-like HicB family nuclease
MKVDVRLYQDEDGIWIAEAPSIPGCGSDGATREEALKNVSEAIALCLEVRRDLKMPSQFEIVTLDIAAA